MINLSHKNFLNLRRLLILVIAVTPCVHANETVVDSTSVRRTFELGAAWHRESRNEYGTSSFTQNSIEVSLLKNWNALGPFEVNLGGRAGVAWQQPEQAQSLRIQEIDFKLAAETGIAYPWLLRPSFHVGAGLLLRKSTLQAQAPVSVSDDPISSFRALPIVFAQLGVGVLLFDGAVGLEPYLRHSVLIGDPRFAWSYGLSLNGYF